MTKCTWNIGMWKQAAIVTGTVLITGPWAGAQDPAANEPVEISQDPTAVEQVIVLRGGDPAATVLAAELADAFTQHTGQVIHVEGGASSQGPASSLQTGIDLSLISQPLGPDELESGILAWNVARDAVAVIVNADSPVDDLSVGQISDIFARQDISWDQGQAVTAFAPASPFSQARQCFEQAALNNQGFGPEVQTEEDLAIPQRVADQPSAIGFTAWQDTFVSDASFKVVLVNGQEPSFESISDNQYPLSRTFSFAALGQPSAHVQAFLDFVNSEPGQQVIRDAGFVPVPQNFDATVQTVNVDTQQPTR